MDNSIVVHVFIEAFAVAALLGGLKVAIAGLEKRLGNAEERIVELPTDYVPRTEVELALSGIKNTTDQIHSMMQALVGGRRGFSGTLRAAAAPPLLEEVALTIPSTLSLLRRLFQRAPNYQPLPCAGFAPIPEERLAAVKAKIMAEVYAPREASANAEESSMSTEATSTTLPKTENGFERFIDGLDRFFKKEAPLADKIANAAKPILALTPLGPEYNLALTGIETAVQADVATQAAATNPLTNTQKMALAVQVATPGLTQVLATKGITAPPAVSAAIAEFVQNVYNLQTGPTATASVVKPAATAVE